MRIERDEVLQISRLARLELGEAEAARLTGEMNAILDYAELLGELDEELEARAVAPTSHAVPMVNALREDVRHESLAPDKALREAPAKEDGAFVVPRVIE